MTLPGASDSQNQSVDASAKSAMRTSRRLGLGLRALQIGDVDPEPGDPAIARAAFGDQDPAPVCEALLNAAHRFAATAEALGEPRLLAADGLGIFSAREAYAHDVLEAGAGDDGIGALGIKLLVALIAGNQAIVGVVNDKPLGDAVDALAQRSLRRRLCRSERRDVGTSAKGGAFCLLAHEPFGEASSEDV